MRSMSIVAVRASLASVSSRVDDRRMHASIPSHPFDARACMHSRARWAWTTMYTHSDSIHSHTKHRCIRFVPHRPCMFYKTCMNDRFVPRIETQYVHTPPWSGSVDTHDGHTHTHIVLYFTLIRIYCPRSTPYTKYKRARPRHAVNQSRMARTHSSTRRRARDWRRASDDDVGERTNERVRRRLRFRRNGTRPRVIHARIIGVGKIHWPRETEKSTREEFIHSFTHSFGSVTRGTEP